MAAVAARELITLALHCTGSVSFGSAETLTIQVQLPRRSLVQLLLLNEFLFGVTTISLQMTGTLTALCGPVNVIVERSGQASPFSRNVTFTLALGANLPELVKSWKRGLLLDAVHLTVSRVEVFFNAIVQLT